VRWACIDEVEERRERKERKQNGGTGDDNKGKAVKLSAKGSS